MMLVDAFFLVDAFNVYPMDALPSPGRLVTLSVADM